MTTLYLVGLVGAVVAFAIWLGFRYARTAGAAQSVAKGRGKVLENVDEANRAVNRLDSDPEYRDKLRKRHTRD